MQDSGSKAGHVTSRKPIEIVDGPQRDSPGAEFSITHYIFPSNMFVDTPLFEIGHRIFLNRSLSTRRARFHQLKAEMFLAAGCSAVGVTIKTPGIAHLHDMRRVFAAQPLGKVGIVQYYYCSLLYEKFSCSVSQFEIYEESILKRRREAFQKWVN